MTTAIMNPIQCPECESYDTGPIGEQEAHLCRGCGIVWSPGKFEGQYSQEELDIGGGYYTGDILGEVEVEEEEDSERCPLCSSGRTIEMVEFCGAGAGRILCQSCGCEFSVRTYQEEEEEPENLHESLPTCPHCAEVDSIGAYGSYEWCTSCWMPPNEPDQESPDIAKLFKGGKGHIGEALKRDIPMLQAQKPMGKFIRQVCGPHCSFSVTCPQKIGNLVKCSREETNREDEESVGKRKRGKKGKGRKKNKFRNKIQRHNQRSQNWHKAPAKVAFFCSKGGLLEKMVLYGTTDPDTEQPGNTGSQSGA